MENLKNSIHSDLFNGSKIGLSGDMNNMSIIEELRNET